VDSFKGGGNEIPPTINCSDGFDAAVLGDRGMDAHVTGARMNWCNLRIDPRDQAPDNYLYVPMEGPARVRCRHANGTLDAHGSGGGLQNALAGDTEQGRPISARKMDMHDLPRGRVHFYDL
jgi:hypothetical protein